MSEFNFEDENDDFGKEQPGDSNAMRNLRSAYNAQKKQLAEAIKALGSAGEQSRTGTLTDLLKKAKVDTTVVDLIGADVPATEEGVNAWVAKYGKAFKTEEVKEEEPGKAPAETTTPVVDAAQQEAFRRAQATEAAGAIPLSLGLDQKRRAIADAKGKGVDNAVAALSNLGLVAD